MTAGLITLADMVANDMNLADIEPSDLLNESPFLAQLPSVESSHGDQHKYPVEDGAPVVGFRAPNAGRTLAHSTDRIETIALKILDFSYAMDKAIADVWKNGAMDYLDRAGIRHIRAAFFRMEEQYFNGVKGAAYGAGHTDGFTGLADVHEYSDQDDTLVNADGQGTNLSSVYLIRQGEEDIMGVLKGGSLEFGETTVQSRVDANGKEFPAYYTPACGWTGIQVGSKHSFVRIANLSATGSEALTDDMLYLALSRFPSNRGPSVIVMNRTQLERLRKSRTATNATGAAAPTPTEIEGVPIIATDAIVDGETFLAEL